MSNGDQTAQKLPDRTLRPIARRVWRAAVANRGLVISVLVLGVLNAFLTKAPFLLISPLVQALTGDAALPVGPQSDALMRTFEAFSVSLCEFLGFGDLGRPLRLCTACAVVASVLGVLGAFAIYGTLVLSRFFAFKIVVDLRNEIAEHILTLPLRFFGRKKMGELISNTTNDTAVLSRALSLACDHVIVDPLLILSNAILVVYFVPEAWWLLLVMVPIMALPMIRMGRKVQKSSGRSLAALGDSTESLNQMLSGMRTVKAFQLEKQRLSEFEAANQNFLRRTLRMLRAKALSQSMVFAGYQAGFGAMLVGTGWLIVHGGYEFDRVGGALAVIATTYTHVKRLSRAYNTLMEAGGALERVESLLDERSDAGASDRGKVLDAVRGEVVFEDVGFAYGEERVLNGVSFSVKPGQTVALVGPSGAGKSTALDLVARFHDPVEGRVLIDGDDLREINLASYRRRTAMVSQQPFLFNTSIYDNIACGRPDVSRDEVIEAARTAQIDDFIMTLPEGYDTLAGERGCNLSGGQMQRVTIARAIVRDPAILILDEATNALDSESEEAVQKALESLMKGRTSFVIAHRLSTVTDADQILVMDSGKIVERGKHAELIELDGLYCRLSQLQQLV